MIAPSAATPSSTPSVAAPAADAFGKAWEWMKSNPIKAILGGALALSLAGPLLGNVVALASSVLGGAIFSPWGMGPMTSMVNPLTMNNVYTGFPVHPWAAMYGGSMFGRPYGI